jgi:hypothetical protein
MSLLGIVAGFLTGLSRAPAVASVLPGVLTLIGGLVAFIFTQNNQTDRHLSTAVGTLALVIALLAGTLWGSMIRADPERLKEVALRQELIRESVCDYRLAYEIEASANRKDAGFADVNPTLQVPGCTPPFSDHSAAPEEQPAADITQ